MLNFKEILPINASAVIQKRVETVDTAAHHGSGALACLLATPAYADLMILASIEAVEKHLPEGFITAGHSMEFTHEAPTGLGLTASVKATLTEIDGNKLTFDIVAFDEVGAIGRGKHTRVIVNRTSFLKRAKERMSAVDRVIPK